MNAPLPPKVQYMVVHDDWKEIATSWPRHDSLEDAQRLKAAWEGAMEKEFPGSPERAKARILKVTSTYEWFDE